MPCLSISIHYSPTYNLFESLCFWFLRLTSSSFLLKEITDGPGLDRTHQTDNLSISSHIRSPLYTIFFQQCLLDIRVKSFYIDCVRERARVFLFLVFFVFVVDFWFLFSSLTHATKIIIKTGFKTS